MRFSTYCISNFTISLMIVTVLTGITLSSIGSATKKARDVRKQMEVSNIFKAVATYHLVTDDLPESPSDQDHCIIGKIYAGTPCLHEILVDDPSHPYDVILAESAQDTSSKEYHILPEDKRYTYNLIRNGFYITARLNGKLKEENRCPYTDDPYLWCKYLEY